MHSKLSLMVAAVSSLIFTVEVEAASTYAPPCELPDQTMLGSTAEDLAYSARACAEQERFDVAAEHLLLMGFYLAFDAQRVEGVELSKLQARLLNESIASLPEPLADGTFFETTVMSNGGRKHRRAVLCKLARKMGPPTYDPSYILEFRLAVANGKTGLVENFSAEKAWERILVEGECP